MECLHTFCCECLKEHALKTQLEGIFPCPECHAKVGVPDCFDQLQTGFLQNSLLDVLKVRQGRDGSEISCGSCTKQSTETSFCFECGRFMCPDCCNAHEILRKMAFEGHKVTAIKHFKVEDYDALLKRPTFCSQQNHEKEVMKFVCVDCRICICQICIITEHKNHSIESLDKAADDQRSKVIAAVESMKEKSKACSDRVRLVEKTVIDLKANINITKDRVSQTAKQVIAIVQEREREANIALDNTLTSNLEKLDKAKSRLQSLERKITEAMEFGITLIERSSSANFIQTKETWENRFQELDRTAITTVPVSSFVKFVPTTEPGNLTFGAVATEETSIEMTTQDFQAGVETEFVIRPKVMNETGEIEVIVEPKEQVGSFITQKIEDGASVIKLVPKIPGTYSINVTMKGEQLHERPFLIQVRERRIEVVGELDFQGQTPEGPFGIAVNSKGLIAVADRKRHCILLFDKGGKYTRTFGAKGLNVGQFNCPCGVAFLDDHNVLVADECNHRIQQFNILTGNVVRVFGSEGSSDGELRNPVNVCLDDEGRVVVADFINNRIQIFTKEGKPALSFGDSGSDHEKLNRPPDCIFYENSFTVSDIRKNCLKIFDRSGRFLRKIEKQGKDAGQLNLPWALCVEKCGNHRNILVCDRWNNRIVQFSVEGSFTGKTVVELPDPVGITTTPDGRILVTNYESKRVVILK